MGSQKGKILGWIVFATLIVGAFAALVALQKKAAPELVAPTPKTEEVVKKPFRGFAKETFTPEEMAEQDSEALNAAMKSGAGCETIQFDEVMRQRCLDTQAYDLGLRNLDEKRCAEINDVAMQTDCLDRVLSALAGQSLDRALCEKITAADLRQLCIDRIQASMGRSLTSAAGCEGIQDQDLKQSCLDNFNLSKSVQDLSLESCGVIQNADLKSRCSETVTKNLQAMELGKAQMLRQYQGTQEKLAGCSEQTDTQAETCKNEANFSLAAEKKDLAYCNAITDPAYQKSCVETQSAAINKYYLRLATAKKDPALCEKILDPQLRDVCLTYAQEPPAQ